MKDLWFEDWPICAKCGRQVDAIERSEGPDTVIVRCHGQRQAVQLAWFEMGLQGAQRELTMKLAFGPGSAALEDEPNAPPPPAESTE